MTGDAGPVSSPGARRSPGPDWPAEFLAGWATWAAAAAFAAIVVLGFALSRTYPDPNFAAVAAMTTVR